MRKRIGYTLMIATFGIGMTLGVGCAPTTPVGGNQGADTRDAYLCCTLRFNVAHQASDANYDYRDKVVFPAGTLVRISMDGNKALIVPEQQTAQYSIEFRYGRKVMQASDFFGRLFVTEDPMVQLGSSATLRQEVRTGVLQVGMSKHEAIMARGYPPAHRTPDLNADDWLYYANHKQCERVRFVAGRIATIESVPPPAGSG